MRSYTFIGFFPETQEVFLDTVTEVADYAEALRKFVGARNGQNLTITAVLDGMLSNSLASQTAVPLSELLPTELASERSDGCFGSLSPAQIQEYNRNPFHCPACGSKDIEAGPPQLDGRFCWTEVMCEHCNTCWKDFYEFASIAEPSANELPQPTRVEAPVAMTAAEQRKQAEALLDQMTPIPGEVRAVYKCRCGQLIGRRYIPYGSGHGYTHNPCVCVLVGSPPLEQILKSEP